MATNDIRIIRPRFIGCRIYSSVNVSIPNASTTPISFNSERYDTHGFHSTSSLTSRITIPAGLAGYYVIGMNANIATSGGGDTRSGSINLNGPTIIAVMNRDFNATVSPHFLITCDYYLNVGDYVESAIFQNSGGALNTQAAGNYIPEMWVHYLGA